MDPLSITTSVMSLTTGCMKIVKTTSDLREKYKHAQTTLSAICAESTVICASLSQIQTLVLRRPEVVATQLSERPELVATFDVAVTGCVAVFAVLDDEVQSLAAHSLEAGNDLKWTDKAKFLWKEGFMKDLLQQIRGLQSALTLLLQAMQLESISELHQLIESHGLMLERIAGQTRSLRTKHPSVAAPASIFDAALNDDAQSVAGTWNTAATDSSFSFDDMIVNSKVYRRILAQAGRPVSVTYSSSHTPAAQEPPSAATPSPPVQAEEVPMQLSLPTSSLPRRSLPTTSVSSTPTVIRQTSSTNLPLWLFGHVDGEFFVFDPRAQGVTHYDILSYCWGSDGHIPGYNCGISGVKWEISLPPSRLDDIKRLMIAAKVQYLWVDVLCIDMRDEAAKLVQISKMTEYYKNASATHIMLDIHQNLGSHDILDNLTFIDQTLIVMGGFSLVGEAAVSQNLADRLESWTNITWAFPVDQLTVRSAAIETAVLNCYSYCVAYVRSVFDNQYFTRVWTFQETLLGKNAIMWGVTTDTVSRIGEFQTWMDLVLEVKDKAHKLRAWLEHGRLVLTDVVRRVLRVLEEDLQFLDGLQLQVLAIISARTDIVNGGPNWWHQNHKGISNLFAAFALRPRESVVQSDLFKGLLGVFSGLFTASEVQGLGGEDFGTLSLRFFRQLSVKTGVAWTPLAIPSGNASQWDWVLSPSGSNNSPMTSRFFASVVSFGRLEPDGRVATTAITGVLGVPRTFMDFQLHRTRKPVAWFRFRGCNCGKTVKTKAFSSRPIPGHVSPRDVGGDETGKTLVQFATLLGSILDPGGDLVEFRRNLLRRLDPEWEVSDGNARPFDWIDRCVSGTPWESPDPAWLRSHNMSMNFNLVDLTGFKSRINNEDSMSIECRVRVNCGCVIEVPLPVILSAISSIEGSSFGNASPLRDVNDRIVLRGGLDLVQVHEGWGFFQLIAFGGDANSYESFASLCRNTDVNKPVFPRHRWPSGRALVRKNFSHGKTDIGRDYGFVETGSSGNLLICRYSPLDLYQIIGICVDEFMENKRGHQKVTIR